MKKSRWLAPILALLLLILMITAVSALTYRIRWGDTLYDLARRFGTSIDAIVAANDQITNPNLIFAGDTIEIPEDGVTVTPTPATPTGTPPTVTPTPTTPPGGGTVYIVRFGDTLFSIARRFNTTVSAIAQANNLANVNLIYVGQRLVIPGPGGGTPPPTSPPPEPDFALGGQSLNLNNQERMTEAGMTWLKIQYQWEAGDDPGEVADDIELAHANDFKILLSITGATPYPVPNSIDFNSFIDFMRGVAALGPDAVEVWNEMNIDFEWPAGQISPTSYVNNMLAPVYTVVEAEDPNILVIGGALAPPDLITTPTPGPTAAIWPVCAPPALPTIWTAWGCITTPAPRRPAPPPAIRPIRATVITVGTFAPHWICTTIALTDRNRFASPS